MNDAIVCRNLLFSYDVKPVLWNVNITIPEGDFVCVVGPNGSGKTTLLKIALGLLKPTSGTIEIFGQAPDRSRGRIGYVPQHPRLDPLFPVSGPNGISPRSAAASNNESLSLGPLRVNPICSCWTNRPRVWTPMSKKDSTAFCRNSTNG